MGKVTGKKVNLELRELKTWVKKNYRVYLIRFMGSRNVYVLWLNVKENQLHKVF